MTIKDKEKVRERVEKAFKATKEDNNFCRPSAVEALYVFAEALIKARTYYNIKDLDYKAITSFRNVEAHDKYTIYIEEDDEFITRHSDRMYDIRKELSQFDSIDQFLEEKKVVEFEDPKDFLEKQIEGIVVQIINKKIILYDFIRTLTEEEFNRFKNAELSLSKQGYKLVNFRLDRLLKDEVIKGSLYYKAYKEWREFYEVL